MLKNNIVHTRGLLGYLKKKYNGVIRINDTVSGVVTTNLTGDIDIDYSNSYGTSDKVTKCNYIILNGYLYFKNGDTLKKVGNSDGWTSVCGVGSNLEYGYGIDSGKLYALLGSTATQVGSATNWTMVSGSSNGSTYGYGIAAGKLYRLSTTTATQIGSSTKWEFIQGGSSDFVYTYGINTGYVYSIKGTTTKKIGTISSFKEVRGVTVGDSNWVLARTDTELYRVLAGSNIILKIDLSKDWVKIITKYGTNKGYAIGNGELYYINLQNGDITQIGDSNTWEDVTEEYAVNKGIVYKLSDATVTKVDVQRCVGIYGAYFPFALCEVK